MTDPGNPAPQPGFSPPNQPPGASPYQPAPPAAANPYQPAPPPAANPYQPAPPPGPGSANPWGDSAPGTPGPPTPPAWGNPTPGPYYQVPSAPPPLGERPQTLKIATYLMIAGGVLSVVTLIAAFTVVDLRALITEAFTQQAAGQDIPQGDIQTLADATYAITAGFIVAWGVIGLFLWLWMAWKNWQGRGWARILATIFAVVGVFNFLRSIGTASAPVLTVLSILNIVVGVVAVVLIWRGDSTEYYEGVRAQRIARVPGAM